MAKINSIKLPNGTTYDIDAKTVNGKTVGTNVPGNADFSDTKVLQLDSGTDSNFRLLLSSSNNDSSTTQFVQKSNKFTANPSTGNMTIGGQLTDKYGLQSVRRISEADYANLSTTEKNNGTIYHRYEITGVPGYGGLIECTQAQYDAMEQAGTVLTDVAYYLTDGESDAFANAWEKIGEDTLDTTAQDCSGAINELKSNLTQLNGLNVVKRITTPASVISFSDGSNLPMYKLLLSIDPIQDLHGYDSPWVGGAGKNKVDVASGSTTTTYTLMQKELNAGTYTYSAYGKRNDGEHWRVVIASQGDETIAAGNDTSGATLARSQVTFTLTETTTIRLKLQFLLSYDTLNYERVQLESGSTATDFEPYSNICPISGFTETNVVVSPTEDAEDGTTYTIQFQYGSNPLTVYGGTLDVISGELTVDRESVDLGTLDWALRPNTNNVFQANVTNIYVPKSVSERNKGMMCSIYKLSSLTYLDDRMDDESMLRFSGMVLVRDLSYQDATAFKTAMNGVQLVYALETTQTYQLTPTQVNSLLGTNNVWADTGDILEVDYTAILNFS